MARRTWWALLMALAACGDSNSSKSSDVIVPSPALEAANNTLPPSTTTTTAPLATAGLVLTTVNGGGDSATAQVRFGDPLPLSRSDVPRPGGWGCLVGGTVGDRGLVVSFHGTVTNEGTLPATVRFSLGEGFDLAVAFNYSAGAGCASSLSQTITFESLAPKATASFNGWIFYPGVLTPNAPNGDPKALGNRRLRGPSLTAGVGSAKESTVYGQKVVACGDVYVVPAGPPQEITTFLGISTCDPPSTVTADNPAQRQGSGRWTYRTEPTTTIRRRP